MAQVWIDDGKGDYNIVDKNDADKIIQESNGFIITCSQCEKPAIEIDHYYPFYSDMCFCEEHSKN